MSKTTIFTIVWVVIVSVLAVVLIPDMGRYMEKNACVGDGYTWNHECELCDSISNPEVTEGLPSMH